MDPREIESLLKRVWNRETTPEEAFQRLETLPYEDLGFAKIDHHRGLRRGFAEVVYGPGKSTEQICAIVRRLIDHGQNVLVTRADRAVHDRLRELHPQALFHEAASAITLTIRPAPALPGRAAVVCAGTSDMAVSEEAAVTAEFNGAAVDRIYDVGVAGLHRLLDQTPRIRQAAVIVVVAGMEGALPSVVSGLVAAPVIAVPTSVGYGASFQGLSALLTMLNSCATGVAVVNIDNGFGAGYLASLILRSVHRSPLP
ncbi:MAG: nickel pincer cofactor biosynthesis protein LarB [Vicinamibacteria bacterium]|nr:nickel pincer cofactor biosynthesis protein LarB [Vicinamibacteria bacterium]